MIGAAVRFLGLLTGFCEVAAGLHVGSLAGAAIYLTGLASCVLSLRGLSGVPLVGGR